MFTDYSTRKFEVQPCNFRPRPQDFVQTIYQGDNFIDVRFMERKIKAKIKKISATEYIRLKTGERMVCKPMTDESKKHSRKVALKKSMRELQWLIRTNFASGEKNQLFITLTYAQAGREMPSKEEIYGDFNKFIKRLKWHYRTHNLEYIVVFEPQANGWFHAHLMLKSTTHKNLIIPKAVCERIWGHGFVQVKRLKSDDVGAYYSAYFTDLILEDEQSRFEMTGKQLTKAQKKGQRLRFYPKYFKFYRCSRGIDRPQKDIDMFYEITKEESEFEPKFEKSYMVNEITENGKQENVNKVYQATFKRASRGFKYS